MLPHHLSHYLGADTTAFQQLLMSDVFKDFPELKIIIPHGGGAVPYHWGRFRGIAQDAGLSTIRGVSSEAREYLLRYLCIPPERH
ncbi:amidohydrolase family protein [Vibrio sp. M60_M31a]